MRGTKIPRLNFTITMLIFFMLGFMLAIPFWDRHSFVSAERENVWTNIYYDSFEASFGNWNDGGTDCLRYTGGTYAHSGSCAIDIQDDSGYAVSATYSNTLDLATANYDTCTIDFWWRAVSMENGEDFYVNYYDGTTSYRIATIVIGTGTYSNNIFYHTVLSISEGDYSFTATARWRIQCDASDDNDDIYLDQIYVNATILYQWNTVASGYFLFDNTPSWKGTDGYFDFSNSDFTPVYDNMTQGWFSFQNVSSWEGSDGYFTFNNTIADYQTFIDGYFTFGNSPSWVGAEGYFTFANTPQWGGEEGYFTFGNISANHTIDEGYFTFSNGEWQGITQGWFTFQSVRAWDNLSSGYFTFGNTVNYTNISQGYFNFSNTPSWHGSDGYFTFGNSPTWQGSQGWFSFGNITNFQNVSQGWFNFSNNVSWHGSEGYFTFGNGAWQNIEQGWFSFENVSTWQTLNQGYFTFGNTSYMIIVSTFPADGDVICPTCYENDTFFYFNAHVDHTNGTLMNITWKTWNGTLLGQVNNVGNGTWHIVPFETVMPITYGSAYNYTINVTDGATFIEKVITFSTDTYTNCMMSTLSPEQFSAIIMLALFMFLFWVGYMGEKRSAGAFMLISGLVLIGEALVAWAYLPMSFGLLLVALGIFIALLGINKWLIAPNMKDAKGQPMKKKK